MFCFIFWEYMQEICEFTNQTFHLCNQLNNNKKANVSFWLKKIAHGLIIFPFNSSEFSLSPLYITAMLIRM